MQLPSNAFSSLTVHRLVLLADGSSTSLTFNRCLPPPSPLVHVGGLPRDPDFPPSKPPSTLPLPGDYRLEVNVGAVIGSGRSSSVLLAQIASISDDEGGIVTASDATMPESVLKVAKRTHRPYLSHEGWLYNEMESIQGIAVPRCYGYFEGELVPGSTLSTDTWLEGWSPAMDWFDRPGNTRVCVLLLEKVGGLTALGEPMPHQDDVREVYDDLAYLGVRHVDVRYQNILLAGPGDSGIECPRHHHQHRHRLVDFDQATKGIDALKVLRSESKAQLRRLFRETAEGYLIEPAAW